IKLPNGKTLVAIINKDKTQSLKVNVPGAKGGDVATLTGEVSLQQELRHLQILIDINTMRFGKLCFIDYNIEGQAEDQLIPPLVLITVVENAFKYGDIRDSNNPLTIKVGLRPGHMHFYCRNKKLKLKPPSSHNIGIKNLRQRLDVLFNDRYHIETINEVEFYTFELTINSI
ncbi:MAG: hypothetical protein QM668_22470, partial [Agriterribacter sp.]